ncbi:hypothetical protein NIES2104_07320 [Leptolyngbya sp. NIES-2104]|nr:hypothetical protein NIES2104_07320 [Leptolyngbya sp. NIES-2104]
MPKASHKLGFSFALQVNSDPSPEEVPSFPTIPVDRLGSVIFSNFNWMF